MILKGDLVLGWMGRVGIAVDKDNPPDSEELDLIFERSLRELREAEPGGWLPFSLALW